MPLAKAAAKPPASPAQSEKQSTDRGTSTSQGVIKKLRAEFAGRDTPKSPDKSPERSSHTSAGDSASDLKAASLEKELQQVRSELAALKAKSKDMGKLSKQHLEQAEWAVRAELADQLISGLYGPEPGWVRFWIIEKHEDYTRAASNGWAHELRALIIFEVRLTFLSVILGPFLTWRAALTLAREATFSSEEQRGGVNADEALRHKLYNRVLTFIEALCEALPQLILQARVFYRYWGSAQQISSVVFGLSIFTGSLSLSKAAFEFVTNYDDIVSTLGPPKSVLAAKVLENLNAAWGKDVDLTLDARRKELQAIIEMAQERGVPDDLPLRPITSALKALKVAELRVVCCGHTAALTAEQCASVRKALSEAQAAGGTKEAAFAEKVPPLGPTVDGALRACLL